MQANVRRQVGAAAVSQRKSKGFGHLRRGEILIAAERIFVERGFEGATIRRIADEVGVSSTALYMHFKDKGEILTEICRGVIDALLAKDVALLARDMDALARVRGMLEVYVDFALEHPHAFQLMYSAQGAAVRDSHPALREQGLKIYEAFMEAMRRAAAEGKLKPGDPELQAQVAWGAAHGQLALMAVVPSFQWRSARDLSRAALDALFHGIAA